MRQARRGGGWALTAVLLGTIACAGGGQADQSDPLPGEGAIGLGRGEALPSFAPAATATQNWSQGEAAFKDEDYLVAQRYYIFIRRKFPYSKFAVLADLRLADCQFERERYLEAIDSYESFARLHPTHPQVPYALFRTGLAHKQLIPNDWFFLPPSHEKDQSAVSDTAKALMKYLKRFPDHVHAEEAQKILDMARKRLMAHERYVADFYEHEGRLRGYVGRLERIKAKYGDVALDADLLVEIAEAYVRLEDAERAQQAVEELKSKFPEARGIADLEAAVKAIPPASAEAGSASG